MTTVLVTPTAPNLLVLVQNLHPGEAEYSAEVTDLYTGSLIFFSKTEMCFQEFSQEKQIFGVKYKPTTCKMSS